MLRNKLIHRIKFSGNWTVQMDGKQLTRAAQSGGDYTASVNLPVRGTTSRVEIARR